MIINNSVKQSYFEWLCSLVSPFDYDSYQKSYTKLLQTLYTLDYITDNTMDMNRLHDGLSLRNRFADECYLDEQQMIYYLDDNCSILEMMVALAFRCEDTIMSDPEKGNRTSLWFREMLESLNIIHQSDDIFNLYYVEQCINNFLNKQYEANGKGGLFTIHNINIDMRSKDIWYQMQAYLCEYDQFYNN